MFVVDDDEAIRRSLRRLMEAAGLRVETFESAQAFLDSYDSARPGCLVLDIKMPGMNGLELQEELARSGRRIPVIVISAHADVTSAVRAMKTGAVDFLKKPYKGRVLLDRIRQSLDMDDRMGQMEAERAQVEARLEVLTAREREVMDLLVQGKVPKQIAFALSLSRKTVDVHRGHILLKLHVDSVVDLVRMINSANGRSVAGSPPFPC